MSVKLAKKGISLLEILIVSLITAILTVSSMDMLATSFSGQHSYNQYVAAKNSKNTISARIVSKVKEATKAYYDSLYIAVPLESYSYYVSAEHESLAVLVPKFDVNGDIVQPSANVTTFKAVAFSIIPMYMIDYNASNYQDYALLETNAEFDLTVSSSDPLVINENLPTDWSSGSSQIIADNLRPAYFSNLMDTAFDVEGDIVNFAFVPKGTHLYFPSYYGYGNIDDSEYLTRCQFRNYRT